MSVTRAEAEFIGYYRRLLGGSRPKSGSHGFVGLAGEALTAFERGLAGGCVRFLLGEGGLAAAGTFDPDLDEHTVDRRFWEDSRADLQLRFSPALYQLLQRIYSGESLEDGRAGALDAADNLVLLMLVQRMMISRAWTARAVAPLAALGPIPRLFYYWLPPRLGDHDEVSTVGWSDLQQRSTLDCILFALQPLLASCWVEGERTLLDCAKRGELERALALAELRGQLFTDYRELAEDRGRLDWLSGFCVAYGQLFGAGGHDLRVLGALEASGALTDIVKRQRAYGRLSVGYRWLSQLQALAETPALPAMGLNRARVIGLFKCRYSGLVTERARRGAWDLFDALNHAEQPQETES